MISVRINDELIDIKAFQFSGGERNVQLPMEPRHINDLYLKADVEVFARLQNPADLIDLLMVQEILNRTHHAEGNRNLVIPYFPYGRQDRVTFTDTAFSLKPICKLINSLKFDEVKIFDPHSDVTSALLERVDVVSQKLLFRSGMAELHGLAAQEYLTVIAPDAGAVKKAFEVAKCLKRPFASATKRRSLSTGELDAVSVEHIEEPLENVLIVDDICDGGATFIKLAKVLRAKGAKKVYLYVTHGIFSKGIENLLDNGIDRVYTTDTFLSGISHPNLIVHKVVGD